MDFKFLCISVSTDSNVLSVQFKKLILVIKNKIRDPSLACEYVLIEIEGRNSRRGDA